jgi:hypothetical protein
MVIERPLWQLLSEDPSDLTCDECFAVMEYYAEVLARGGDRLLPKVLEHLRRCPSCEARHRKALRHLMASQPETSGASRCDLPESSRSDIEE